MANLPAEWHQISRPVRHDLEFFVAAGGGATWDPFQLRDAADGILDLTGCTISAEIRNDNDELLVVLTVTDAGFDIAIRTSATPKLVPVPTTT